METVTQTTPYQLQFEEFFNTKYRAKIEKLASLFPDEKALLIDYALLEEYDTDLADELIDNPYPIIKAAQEALSQLKLVNSQGEDVKLNVRFVNMPKDGRVMIRDIDSTHIGQFISIDGLVTTVTESRPKLGEEGMVSGLRPGPSLRRITG